MTEVTLGRAGRGKRLSKALTLPDVYAISTGAMFSSGFFLLPGIAAAQTGSSVSLAYLAAAVLILPAMFCMAELATAMPRAGGAYYFLDRSMGPLVGTIGGLGTWVGLVLKSAFALIGMGAYLAIFFDIPIKPLAVALTVLFAVVNLVGAKESSRLQRWLVFTLVGILGWFLAEGLFTVIAVQDAETTWSNLGTFETGGMTGFAATIGLVFVSYAGLTKVAAVAEEVHNPDRNLPLGMILSLVTATIIYVAGVFLLGALIPAEVFHQDLTPVATAAEPGFNLLPSNVGVALIVVAATAAFASTGNAGIMSASRYPLAMARDRLIPERFGQLGRSGTPNVSIFVTSLMMIVFITLFDISAVAKLASAFTLFIFMLVAVAVLVMRESHIAWYRPGFKTPLYPWVPLLGIVAPIILIVQMGAIAILFTLGLSALAICWYYFYGRQRVVRTGAIYHVFQRLGRRAHRGLDQELRGIVTERGHIEDDPFEEVVERAVVVDIGDSEPAFRSVIERAARAAHEAFGLDEEWLTERIMAENEMGFMPTAKGAALPHVRVGARLEHPELIMVRIRAGVSVPAPARDSAAVANEQPGEPVHAILILLSPEGDDAMHLRMLAQLAARAQDTEFLPQWRLDDSADDLRKTLLRDLRFLHARLNADGPWAEWIGREIRRLGLPAGTLVALVRRDDATFVPRPRNVVQEGDMLTIIGNPEVLRLLRDRAES